QTSAIKPRNSVRLWCLAPTSGTSVTVAYKSNSPSGPIPSTVLTVKCKAPSVTKIATPSSTVVDPIVGRAPFSVVSCSTGDVFGTSCSNNGNNVRLTCRLDAYADTLPVTATATVTVEGASAIDDQQISFPFECM
ncbi:MAG TPA: hypothetical protein VMB72_06645, partial [Acidimicrobiales bacterium]|nr:hypothetical protein [Acidimicrobiales bacterium]